jgi:ElaB/YqjD/DUF883 family membrane-anchored ribosome-binding protein
MVSISIPAAGNPKNVFRKLAELQARALSVDQSAGMLRHYLTQGVPDGRGGIQRLTDAQKAGITPKLREAEAELESISAEVNRLVTHAEVTASKARKAGKKSDKLTKKFKAGLPQMMDQLAATNPQAATAMRVLMDAQDRGDGQGGKIALDKVMSLIPPQMLGKYGAAIGPLSALGSTFFSDDDDENP